MEPVLRIILENKNEDLVRPLFAEFILEFKKTHTKSSNFSRGVEID